MKEFWLKVWEQTKKICKRIADKDMWCKVGRVCLKILNVPVALLILLTIITVIALLYVFGFRQWYGL